MTALNPYGVAPRQPVPDRPGWYFGQVVRIAGDRNRVEVSVQHDDGTTTARTLLVVVPGVDVDEADLIAAVTERIDEWTAR